jgi:hypothetical protein
MFKPLLSIMLVFTCGFMLGGYLFSRVQPRPFLELMDCDNCGKRKELGGYIASLGYQFAPYLSPNYIESTDKCTVISHVQPREKFHYVAFPRKDIKDIADLTDEDVPYVVNCLALFQRIISENNITSYKVYTNGPDRQDVRMLHFHLTHN